MHVDGNRVENRQVAVKVDNSSPMRSRSLSWHISTRGHPNLYRSDPQSQLSTGQTGKARRYKATTLPNR